MRRVSGSGAALLAAASLSLAVAVAGAEEEPGPNPDHEGYPLYQRLCSECHGVAADGRGPRAAQLDPPPPDLTRLRGADGRPPRQEDLARVIDGRRTIRAHGSGEMPVWGWVLVSEESNPQLREKARAQFIRSLADYVVSIQRPPKPEDAEAPAEEDGS